MASKNERLDITMRILGARQMEREGKIGAKAVEAPGKAAKRTVKETTKASKATSLLTKSYGRLGKAAKYGLGFLGVGGVLALQSAVHNTEELSKTTTGLNRNLGLSIQEGSRWAAVANAREIATTTLNMSFTKLGKSFVEANRKGGTARTALNQLGVTYNETTKGAHDFNYALGIVGKKLGEAKAGPQRQSAAMALLGKGYKEVLPLFSQGNKGLQEQLHWADKYGVTLDGKTNKSLMDMVTAQRESKVAMLGLQVSMTKALMPAIEGGEENLQTFIKTLNDPKMSGAEKITAIQKQFEGIEDTLLRIITAALPKVAEHAGQLGIKMAEAVWTGFKNSNFLGKLVIGAWLFKAFGGGALISSIAGAAGSMIVSGVATGFANRFPVLTIMMQDRFAAAGGLSGAAFDAGLVLGVAAASVGVGYLIYEHLSEGTKTSIRRWGSDAGEWFVNALINVVNGGISLINEALNNGNAFAFLGVEAPQIGEIGGVNFHGAQRQQNEEAVTHRKEGLIDGPGGKPIKPFQPHSVHPGGGKSHKQGRRQLMATGGPPIVIHHKTYLDGRVVAESTTRHAEDAAAVA